MIKITKIILDELLLAMDVHKELAQRLIDKLLIETNQPKIQAIKKGDYFQIQNAALYNGGELLSDNWAFDVHGEHCFFENAATGQKLEVSLIDRDSIGNLDPYFFYDFIKTTDSLKHLTQYLGHPFSGTCNFFEELERQQMLTRISGVQFRKQ